MRIRTGGVTGVPTGAQQQLFDHQAPVVWMPEDPDGQLAELAIELIAESARLDGCVPPGARDAIIDLVGVANAHYAVSMHGQLASPHAIEVAKRADLADDRELREAQIEGWALNLTESRLRMALRTTQKRVPCASGPFLQGLHRRQFRRYPRSKRTAEPGVWRTGPGGVGSHVWPPAEQIPSMMAEFARQYPIEQWSRVRQVIAAAAAHHRFLAISPFADGNGCVARDFSQAVFARAGVDVGGMWSIARGLARTRFRYLELLAQADGRASPSGSGPASPPGAGLTAFCRYLLNTALDEVRFVSRALKIDSFLARVVAAVQADEPNSVPAGTAQVVREAILRGPLPRGEALALLPGKPRQARERLAEIIDAGLLEPTSSWHKSTLRFHIPIAYGPSFFPDLFPPAAGEEEGDTDDAEDDMIKTWRSMNPDDVAEAASILINEQVQLLQDTDPVSSEMASANAFFEADLVEVSAEDVEFTADEAHVTFSFVFTGEQHEDRMWCGDRIDGTATAVIDGDGRVRFENVTAHLEDAREAEERLKRQRERRVQRPAR